MAVLNGHALKPANFDLVCRVAQAASQLAANPTISIGSAVDAACRRLRIVLDDDSYVLVVTSLGFYRQRLAAGR